MRRRARARGDRHHPRARTGQLISRVGPTFSLAEIAAAHEAVERGTIGNVIVKIR